MLLAYLNMRIMTPKIVLVIEVSHYHLDCQPSDKPCASTITISQFTDFGNVHQPGNKQIMNFNLIRLGLRKKFSILFFQMKP